MFGIRYFKSNPTQYIVHYHNGRKKRAGAGLAFFYYQPTSAIVVIPLGSADVPFIFNEITADFQPVTVQGQFTYCIRNPEMVASLLDHTIDGSNQAYRSDDPQKLALRLVNLVQVLARAELQHIPLSGAMHASDDITQAIMACLRQSEMAAELGVEVLAVAIQAIRPTPESARALEAEAREDLLRRADQAIYERRNAAVEQERRIKENELNTEIAVEEKKRQIRETKVEADLAVDAREQQVREAKLNGQIRLEQDRAHLVQAKAENTRAEADAQAYTIEASLRPLRELDPELLQVLAMQSTEPRLMVSLAMKELAKNAGKIGNLNFSPELMQALIEAKK
ncbi:MAG: hypothetical protein JW726_04560 [Anaerolineales bacterium]|nr:hypothetical protein [Anaerolineales bacterium]